MGELNPSSTTTTNFSGRVPDFIVNQIALDNAEQNSDESYWYFADAQTMWGYYFQVPEIFSAANTLATWSTHRGYQIVDRAGNPTTGSEIKPILEHIRGHGKDSFISIMWNHLVTKLVIGDAFTEVKRKDGKIINMIPHSPERIRIVFTKKTGLIKRYDVFSATGEWMPIAKEDMLHSYNKRVGDQCHGTSQITASKFVIDAKQEALQDERTIKHRDKALGIVYYKTDKAGKISYMNSQIEEGVRKGEMIGLPEDAAKIEPYPSRSSEDRTGYMQYLDNLFYQVFGVPRSIASSDGTSEVGGKMGHVIFEPIYTKEQLDLENDLWTQQQIPIKFNRPPSLGGLMKQEEQKNSGQTAIQPNDVTANLNRE